MRHFKVRPTMRINRDTVANAIAALCHHFRETAQVVRCTFHSDVRIDLLDRLLTLNHQRHAEEVTAGLREKKQSNEVGGKGRKVRLQQTQCFCEMCPPKMLSEV